MAHDVWLFRRSLIACLFLGILLGYADGTNARAVATDRGSLYNIKEFPSKAFPSQALHHLTENGSSKAGHMKQKFIRNDKNKSRRVRVHPRLKGTRLKESHRNWVSKKILIERIQVTDANRRRMQVLDSYFVHPQNMKEPFLPESNFPRSKEWLQSALSLDGLQPGDSNSDTHLQKVGSELLSKNNLDGEMPSRFLDWSRKGFRTGELTTVENQSQKLHEIQGTLNAKTYDENSVEGQKIVNTASVVHRFNESQATGVINSLEHQGEKVIDEGGAFQSFHPTNSSLGSKQTYRYKFINSLIKPQLAGILADLKDLEAPRHRHNPVDFKALKNDLMSHKLATEKEVKEEEAGQNLTKQENANEVQTEGEKIKTKLEPQYHSNDMFILGAPNRSTYVHDLFLANPVPINHFSGSEAAYGYYKERLKELKTALKIENQFEKLHRESRFHNSSKEVRTPPQVHMSKGTAAANHDGSLNQGFDRFRGSGVEESVHSGEKWYSNGSGSKSDTRFGSQPVHETVRKVKPTSRVTFQSLKYKVMSHIEKKNDKDGSGMINFSGKTSSNTQRIRPLSYFRPTGGQVSSKVTTVSSFKRTTIAHVESGSDSDFESWSISSGEGSVFSGSGEEEAFLQYYHKPKPTLRPLSSTREHHTGIVGVTDKETESKCEKMGKSDYREECPHGWLPFEQFCYFFVPHPVRKWDEFPPKCNEESALLAMPKTDKQLGFLQDKISSSKYEVKYFYIGLKKNDGAWKWIDDMPYTRVVNVTDELGTKNCSGLSKDSEMHIVTCNEPKAGYVCELRTAVKAISILALGDSLTSGFHSEDKNHTPYAKTLEYLLNKDVHRCYTLTTVARDGIEASEISALLKNHLRNSKSKYTWVIILAGTNDILHNSGHSNEKAWDTAVHNIIDLHIMSHRFGAKTMAVTIPEMDCEESDKLPCQRTRLERQYINEKIRHYARTNEFTILCDLATKFPRYSLKSEERNQFWEEGLHMKIAGYERMAEIIYRDLLAHIDDDESLK